MKPLYTAIIAIVVIAIIIGSVGAYVYVNSNSAPSPTPTPIPTATPTTNPSATPTPTTTAHPTSTPTTNPSATPTPAPTASPTLAPATLNGAGGTLVAPLMSVWQHAYESVRSQITVNYNAVGSGTGIANFQAQIVDFGETDAPMTTAQYAALPSGTTAITIPIAASAVVPAYNLPLTNGSICQNGLNFTGSILADIFLGNIVNWDDAAIQNINPTVPLPHHQIITVHRSDGSGTMFAFTDYLSQASTAWANGPGKGTSVTWPNPGGVAIGAPKNSGVAGAISGNQYSIGPLEVAYVLQNPGLIYYGAVQNAAGNYVLATIPTISSALTAGASTGLPAGNAAWTTVSMVDNVYTNTTATTAYPVITLTYALAYQQQTSLTQGAALVNFLSWVVNNGQTLGTGLGYVPLPANIIAVDNASLKLITYNGTPILS